MTGPHLIQQVAVGDVLSVAEALSRRVAHEPCGWQAELSRALSMRQEKVSVWFSGTKKPTLRNLVRIADAVGMSLTEFLTPTCSCAPMMTPAMTVITPPSLPGMTKRPRSDAATIPDLGYRAGAT